MGNNFPLLFIILSIAPLIFAAPESAKLANKTPKVGEEEEEGQQELILVQALWRHGDRAPTGTFKTDIYQEDFWPQGWGQLSPRGMQQQVVLGKKLRKRYVDELKHVSGTYNSHELYVRATDVNRTLTSAISNFIGFYGKGRPNRDFPDDDDWPFGFVPIAIHTVEGDEDYIGCNAAICPRHDELYELMMQTPEYQNADQHNAKLLEFLSQKAERRLNIFDIWVYQDTFYVEKDNNLTLVDWADTELLQQIEALHNLQSKWESGIGMSPINGIDFGVELPRIRGGPLLWTMIGNMANKMGCVRRLNARRAEDREIPGLKSPLGAPICQWLNRIKYIAYSAHDTTITALFSVFGFPKTNYDQDGYPHYTSCVTIELWRDKRMGQLSVKVLYWKPDAQSYVDITRDIEGCEFGCTLEQFEKRSLRYRMEPNPKEYCHRALFPPPTTPSTTSTTTPPPSTTTQSPMPSTTTPTPSSSSAGAGNAFGTVPLLLIGCFASFAISLLPLLASSSSNLLSSR